MEIEYLFLHKNIISDFLDQLDTSFKSRINDTVKTAAKAS